MTDDSFEEPLLNELTFAVDGVTFIVDVSTEGSINSSNSAMPSSSVVASDAISINNVQQNNDLLNSLLVLPNYAEDGLETLPRSEILSRSNDFTRTVVGTLIGLLLGHLIDTGALMILGGMLGASLGYCFGK